MWQHTLVEVNERTKQKADLQNWCVFFHLFTNRLEIDIAAYFSPIIAFFLLFFNTIENSQILLESVLVRNNRVLTVPLGPLATFVRSLTLLTQLTPPQRSAVLRSVPQRSAGYYFTTLTHSS